MNVCRNAGASNNHGTISIAENKKDKNKEERK
jgi:hypothetical protein